MSYSSVDTLRITGTKDRMDSSLVNGLPPFQLRMASIWLNPPLKRVEIMGPNDTTCLKYSNQVIGIDT
jgi:hypothetical protein